MFVLDLRGVGSGVFVSSGLVAGGGVRGPSHDTAAQRWWICAGACVSCCLSVFLLAAEAFDSHALALLGTLSKYLQIHLHFSKVQFWTLVITSFL